VGCPGTARCQECMKCNCIKADVKGSTHREFEETSKSCENRRYTTITARNTSSRACNLDKWCNDG
jgi:hypothetical protein